MLGCQAPFERVEFAQQSGICLQERVPGQHALGALRSEPVDKQLMRQVARAVKFVKEPPVRDAAFAQAKITQRGQHPASHIDALQIGDYGQHIDDRLRAQPVDGGAAEMMDAVQVAAERAAQINGLARIRDAPVAVVRLKDHVIFPAAMPLFVQANKLTKFYGLRPVLRGVSLDVSRGDFLAVLGANGAGKTTFLRILATLNRPTSGTLTIGGVDVLRHPDQARALIGMVSHHSMIYPDLSAYENVRFHAVMHGAEAAVEDALRRVDLWPRAHDPARTLSRGMTQRLAIARALVHDPPLLLLDEPFTGLDQTSAERLSDLLNDTAAQGCAVVMTTHEFGRGLRGVTRAVAIRDGVIAGELDDPAAINAQTLSMLVNPS